MDTPIHYIAQMDTYVLSGQVSGVKDLLLPALPEFIGALAAMLVSTGVTWALQKWRSRGTSEIVDDDIRD